MSYRGLKNLGKANITPSELGVAGSYDCWALTYKVGSLGIKVEGGIGVGAD